MPRYWAFWALFACMRLTIILPHPLLMCSGRGLGWLAWRILRIKGHHRVAVVRTNLRLCFASLSTHEKKQLEKKIWQSLGMGIMETALAWWAKRDTIDRLVAEVEGFEAVQKAHAEGRPIQILYGHFSTLELAGRWLGDRLPIDATSKRYHNPLSHWMIIRHRQRYLRHVLMPDAFKHTLRLLKAGGITSFMLDLDFGLKDAVFDTFMGAPCATSVMNAKLAKQLNTVVIPMHSYRLPNNQGYGIAFLPPVHDYGQQDPATSARQFNAWIEAAVEKHPEQYYWLHRRFKTQPDGKSPYHT